MLVRIKYLKETLSEPEVRQGNDCRNVVCVSQILKGKKKKTGERGKFYCKSVLRLSESERYSGILSVYLFKMFE